MQGRAFSYPRHSTLARRRRPSNTTPPTAPSNPIAGSGTTVNSTTSTGLNPASALSADTNRFAVCPLNSSLRNIHPAFAPGSPRHISTSATNPAPLHVTNPPIPVTIVTADAATT